MANMAKQHKSQECCPAEWGNRGKKEIRTSFVMQNGISKNKKNTEQLIKTFDCENCMFEKFASLLSCKRAKQIEGKIA